MPLRLSTVETNAGALFALGVLSMAYVLNQVDRYSLSVVSKPLERGVGFGDREGGGVEYDVLVGPVFTVVYIVSGLGFGVLGDRRSRKHILCAALFVWSAATALMGAATAYWQLVLLRAVQGFGEAGCTPPAAAMIADIFLPRHRGKALGVFQWGVYVGYSLAFGVINVTTQHLGFRAAFLVVGAPGILLAALILATVREPPRQLPTRDPAAPAPLPVQDSAEADPPPVAAAAAAKSDTNESAASASARPQSPALTPRRVLDVLLLVARSPPLLLLCVGGSIRNAAGIVWAYNVNSFFQNQHNLSHEQIAAYLSWIPLVAGSLGSALGGILADRIFTRHGNFGRALLLTASCLVAAPLAFAILHSPPPACFLLGLPKSLVAEMWAAVALNTFHDLLPVDARVSGLSVYIFLVTLVGGNAPVLVTPATSALGSRRAALSLLFPGFYVFGGLLFLASALALRRSSRLAPEALALDDGASVAGAAGNAAGRAETEDSVVSDARESAALLATTGARVSYVSVPRDEEAAPLVR